MTDSTHRRTDDLVALAASNGAIIPPPTAAAIADALALDWIGLLDATRGDADAAWAIFYPRLVEAFDQVVTDWRELEVDGVKNTVRFGR